MLAPHITQFIDSMGPGGGQRQMVLLCQGLRDRGWRVRLAWYNQTAAFFEAPAGIDGHRIARQGRADAGFAARIAKLCTRRQTDLVHAWLAAPSMYAALASRLPNAAPVVTGVLCGPEFLDTVWYDGLCHLAAARMTSHVTANCQPALDWLHRKGIAAERTHFVGNVVDPALAARQPSTPEQRQQVLQSLGLGGGEAPIVCLGRFDRWKNQDGLVRALLQLRSRGVAVPPVVLAGFLEDEARVHAVRSMAQAADLADVLIVPAVRDVATLLEAARFSVLASHSEGLPNVVLEAMALGQLVVATRVGHVPWFVQDGQTGILCSPDDDAALADALARALATPPPQARAMGAAARDFVLREFSEDRVVGQADALYRQILGHGP